MSNLKNGYILKGGRVIDPIQNIDKKCDIAIYNDKIVDSSILIDPEVIDVSGLIVAPGFIDVHVHLRQPGRTDKESIATGTRSAAAGGFTTIVPMPNTSPVADNAATIEYIQNHAKAEGVVKILPCAAMTKGLQGKEMSSIGSLKKRGIVALSDDGCCVQNHEIMRHIVEYAKTFDLPILDHCEDENLASNGVMHEGEWSTLLGLRSIPAAAEELMVARDAILSEVVDWKIHIQHISSKGSLRIVREAQKRGVQLSAEVTPHHIALSDSIVKTFDSNYKMNPPLMSNDHREALIEGLKDGTITCIATDHAPHTETDKMVEFDYAPFGVVGLETALSICLTELYHKNHLSLLDFVSKFTKGPAELLNLDLGSLKEGAQADITIFDPDKSYVIDKNDFYSKGRNTPFDGWDVKGKVSATIVDGAPIYSKIKDLLGVI